MGELPRFRTSLASDTSPPAHMADVELVARIVGGLELLVRAYDYSQDVGSDVWDFASEIRELRPAGLTTSDLRWLVSKGYAQHAREISLPGDERRTFRAEGGTFTKRTCFVLTAGGAAVVRKLCDRTASRALPIRYGIAEGRDGVARALDHRWNRQANGPEDAGRAGEVVPVWNRDLQELSVQGVRVKQFKVPAPNQETILAAFEEEQWPPRIDDPLPPRPDQDPKRRLHDTINSLNRNQKHDLIRFIGDGTGQGVRWALIRRDPTQGMP